jgi:magnesium-transporting ATPase (P-type)
MTSSSPSTGEQRTLHHARAAKDVLGDYEVTRAAGLSAEEAARRLERFGRNELPAPKRRGPLLRFLLQFHNVLIYVLVAAGIVTALLGHWIDSGVIFGVVLINAIIGFIQEGKAEEALDAIRKMLSLRAQVMRDGHRTDIRAEEVVPGRHRFSRLGRQGSGRPQAGRGAQPAGRGSGTHGRIGAGGKER